MRLTPRKFAAVAMLAAALVAACGQEGGYQRGLFQGYVVGSTDDEIMSKVGKPDEVDTSNPKVTRWVYKKKTFDPNNQNQVDSRTTVILEPDAGGKLRGVDVIFSAS